MSAHDDAHYYLNNTVIVKTVVKTVVKIPIKTSERS